MTAQQLCRLLLTGLCSFATLGTGRAAPPEAARPAAQATNAAVLFPAFGFWANVPGTQAWAATNGLAGGRAGTNSSSGHGGVGRPDKDAQPDKGNTGNESAFTMFTVPTPLLAHWRFDETGGTTAADSSGNNLHGTLSASGAAFVSSGMAGNALQLTKSANGTVNMGNVLGLTSGSFSLAVWVRMNAGDTTDASMLVARHAPGYHNGWFLNLNTAGAPWAGQPNKAMFYNSGGDLTGAAVSTTSVNDGQWHHIVVVYDSGLQKRLYVDGSPVEGTGAANGILANNAPFLVGGLMTGGSTPKGYFTGWVDELMVFGTALTSTEVDDLYASYVLTAPGTPAGLAAQAGHRQVTLTWSAATPGVTSYRVKRATAAAGPYSVIASPAGTSFVDTGLDNGTTYYYRVSAVNVVGESQDSPFVAATPSALLAHWRFDEASGTTAADSSGNNLHGTLSPAGAAFVSGGKAGNALQLTKSANGYVNMGAGNALALSGGSFSLAVWVRMNAGDTTDASMIVTRHLPGYQNGWFLNANTAGAPWAGQPNKALFYDAGSDFTGAAVSTTSINDGQWHHVVAVYDLGVQKRAYVDGVPVEGTGPANGFQAGGVPFLVGGLQWTGAATPTGYFTGWLDELMVFSAALTDAEIGTLYDSYNLPVPNPPASLAAVPGDLQVSLSWPAVAGATSYTVKRSLSPNGPFTALPGTTATALTDTGLNNGTTYHYVVTAWNSAGESAPSPAASATPAAAPTGPPDAPTGLTATAGNQQVTLNWTAVTPGVIAYNVKYATTAGGPYQPAGTVSAFNTTFTTPLSLGLVNGTTYYFVVSAVNSLAEGSSSTEASATPTLPPPTVPPAPPASLSAVPGDQRVVLTWPASSGAASYKVKRYDAASSTYVTLGTVTGTAAMDLQVANGTIYSYVVSAGNAAGESANSTPASATPAASTAVPTPIARTDAFQVEQDSGANPLGIMDNDEEGVGYANSISQVTAAARGTINYTADGATFDYTPGTGEFGMDQFTYTLANSAGGNSSASAYIFINQTGNTAPTADDSTLTLPVNQSTLNFAATVNAVDADTDPLQFVAFIERGKGALTVNASGIVTYTRPPGMAYADRFSYALTDGGYSGNFVAKLG